MRSSGIAQISKIEKRNAHARTRLIFISNPRSYHVLSTYNFGCDAISELIGSPEDVRRFDIAVIAASDQVHASLINQFGATRPNIEHKAESDLCRRLVLFAWTRTNEQVLFESDAEQAILSQTNRLCNEYTDILPLIDRGTTRHKIARLAVALAVRTFSVSEDHQSVLVRKCHVDYISNFLDELYSDSAFGYRDYSKAQVAANIVKDPSLVIAQIMSTKYPDELVSSLLFSEEITAVDLADWCEMDFDLARRMISMFVRKHAVFRKKNIYVKTPDFITLLKKLEEKGVPDIPQHFDEEI